MQLTVFRCRQCRHLLTSSRNVVEVSDGGGQQAFPLSEAQQRGATELKRVVQALALSSPCSGCKACIRYRASFTVPSASRRLVAVLCP